MFAVKSRKFAELSIGTTDSIVVNVTQEEIERFAELSGDVAPLHTDDSFARKFGFDGRIAHGFLIGAYISRFIGNCLPGANGILQHAELSFRNPLVPPASINIEGVVESISASVNQVVIRVNVTDARGVPIALAKVKSIVKDIA